MHKIGITIVLLIFIACKSSNDCDLSISLNLEDSIIKISDPKNIHVDVFNKSTKDTIVLQNFLYHGYKDDPETEIYFEIKHKKNDYYEEIEKMKNVDYDYFPMPGKNKHTFLAPDSTLSFLLHFNDFYNLEKPGEYKIRAIVDFKEDMCDRIKTEWVGFRIIE